MESESELENLVLESESAHPYQGYVPEIGMESSKVLLELECNALKWRLYNFL